MTPRERLAEYWAAIPAWLQEAYYRDAGVHGMFHRCAHMDYTTPDAILEVLRVTLAQKDHWQKECIERAMMNPQITTP